MSSNSKNLRLTAFYVWFAIVSITCLLKGVTLILNSVFYSDLFAETSAFYFILLGFISLAQGVSLISSVKQKQKGLMGYTLFTVLHIAMVLLKGGDVRTVLYHGVGLIVLVVLLFVGDGAIWKKLK